MHISSSYAKILGGILFRTWEFPRSGSKAKDGEKRGERKKERLNDGNNNGQAMHGARKPPGPITILISSKCLVVINITAYQKSASHQYNL